MSRLEFWAEEDLPAYAATVEELFASYLSGLQDTDLMLPIARRWQRDGASNPGLVEWLSRWLQLVYPCERSEDTAEEAAVRARYPRTNRHPQLRLTYAAISAISLRPERTMLPALAHCVASARLCEVTPIINGKPHPNWLKSPYENLGILLRWGFTETVIPELAELATSSTDDLREGYVTLAELTCQVKLPQALHRTAEQSRWTFKPDTPERALTTLRNWLAKPASERDPHAPRLWHLDLFAVYECVELKPTETSELIGHLATTLAAAVKSAEAAAAHDIDAMWNALFPWVARFASCEAISSLAADYWGFVIHCDNPAGAAISAPLVPLPADQIDQLAALVETRIATRIGRANFDSVVTRACKIVFLSGTEVQIIRWLELGIHTPCGLGAEAWEILPVPRMLEKIATPRLAEMVWARFEKETTALDAGVGNRASIYWLKIYVYCVTGDEVVATYALDQLRTLPTEHPWVISFIRIVVRSRASRLLDAVLEQPELRRHLASDNAAHNFSWFLRVRSAWCPRLGFAEMLETLHPNVVAILVGLLPDEEQVKYARYLAKIALCKIAVSAAQQDPLFRHNWIVDESGGVIGWSLDEASGGSGTFHYPQSSVWGVDRNESGFFTAIKERADGASRESQLEGRERRLNAAIYAQNTRLENIERRHLAFFRANDTLNTWARKYSAEFTRYCQEFFAAWENTPVFECHFEISAFSEALLKAWSMVDLDAACRRRASGVGRISYGSGTRVWVHDVIPSDRFQLLSEPIGDMNGAQQWRLKALEECETDRDILQCVQAAMLGGSINWIRSSARHHYGKSPFAKERALAVTLLAFAGESEDDCLLSEWVESDESRWVRDHADWARRVQRQIRTAEARWAEIRELAERPDACVEIIATKLAVLKPVLPPTALAWPHVSSPVPQVAALLHAFRYNWESAGGAKGERELCQRKPHEFCRGERVNDVTKRMAPWWQL